MFADNAAPVSSLLKPVHPNVICDAIAQPPQGRRPLFVLAGYGHALRRHLSLAEPQDFSARLRINATTRDYLVETLDFRLFPQAGTAAVDLEKSALYRLDTPGTERLPVFLICSDARYAQDFEAQITSIAFEAASVANDWRVENALEWCTTESRARNGELQPETGIKLPAKLRWRLRKPVFRAENHDVLYQWELCSLVEGPYERPLITCVTNNEGSVTREADLLPIRLMFNRPAAAPAAPTRPIPAPAPSAPDAEEELEPETLKTPAAPEKLVPKFRREKLAEKKLAEEQTQMAKIRRLFEL